MYNKINYINKLSDKDIEKSLIEPIEEYQGKSIIEIDGREYLLITTIKNSNYIYRIYNDYQLVKITNDLNNENNNNIYLYPILSLSNDNIRTKTRQLLNILISKFNNDLYKENAIKYYEQEKENINKLENEINNYILCDIARNIYLGDYNKAKEEVNKNPEAYRFINYTKYKKIADKLINKIENSNNKFKDNYKE